MFKPVVLNGLYVVSVLQDGGAVAHNFTALHQHDCWGEAASFRSFRRRTGSVWAQSNAFCLLCWLLLISNVEVWMGSLTRVIRRMWAFTCWKQVLKEVFRKEGLREPHPSVITAFFFWEPMLFIVFVWWCHGCHGDKHLTSNFTMCCWYFLFF